MGVEGDASVVLKDANAELGGGSAGLNTLVLFGSRTLGFSG